MKRVPTSPTEPPAKATAEYKNCRIAHVCGAESARLKEGVVSPIGLETSLARKQLDLFGTMAANLATT